MGEEESRFKLENGLPILAFSVSDFCRSVGIGKSKVYEMIKEGRLKTGILEGRRIIPVSEAERVVAEAMAAAEDGKVLIKQAPSKR